MAQQTVVVDVALLGKMAGYIEILVKDPHSTVFAALSDIYRAFGLHEEAVAVAQTGTEMVPTYVPGFIALGRALAENGDSPGASHAYRKALDLDSNNLAALTGLASSCLGCGESEEALVFLTRAQSIDPNDEVVKQLSPIVKKLAVISPSVPVVLDTYSPPPLTFSSEEIKAVDEESVDHSVGVVSLPPIATATLADIYIKQGFLEKALKVFSDILEDDPKNVEIRQRYDGLQQKINGSVVTPQEDVAIMSPITVEPVSRAVEFSADAGRDALLSLYGRWLDAVNRRRADVH